VVEIKDTAEEYCLRWDGVASKRCVKVLRKVMAKRRKSIAAKWLAGRDDYAAAYPGPRRRKLAVRI